MNAYLQTVVGAVIVEKGRVLAARRTRPPALAGRWEFPGGKVEPGEGPQEALVREIAEELGATIEVGLEVSGEASPWRISEKYELRLFLATLVGTDPEPGDDHDLLQWVTPSEMDRVEWLASDLLALADVRSLLARL